MSKTVTLRLDEPVYRLFYSVNVDERIVFMLTVDDRKDAYR